MMQMTQSPDESTRQLRKRLFFYLAAALFVMAFCLTIAVSITLFTRLKKAENESVVHLAAMRSMAITEWCRRAKDVANQITSRSRIRQELEKYNQGKLDLQQLIEFTKPKLEDGMYQSDEVVGILRLDVRNRIVTGCGDGSILSKNNSDVMNYIFDDATLSAPMLLGDRRIIIVSAPIINRSGERQGTDLVIMDLELLRNIVTDSETIGETSVILLGYRTGDSISSVLYPEAIKDHFPEKSDLLSAVQNCIFLAINGKTGLLNIASTVMAYQPVDECDWGLVITQNQSELYFPVYQKMGFIIALSAVVYFIILTGFLFLLKPLTGKILLRTDELEKKIQEKTKGLEKEIKERKKAEKEKEQIILELKEAMEKNQDAQWHVADLLFLQEDTG